MGMNWTSVPEVRRITGISESTYSDSEIQEFINAAQREVNSKILVEVIREPIVYLDTTRKNSIDGVNKTYYIKNWKGNYLADRNYDGSVTISDIVVYKVASDGTETTLTPTSVDVTNCSFTLTTAQNDCRLYISYAYTRLDPVTPNQLVYQATTYLTASYLFVGDETDNIRFGNVSIGGSNEGRNKQFYNKYLELLRQINENSTGGAIWGVSTQLI
jgi:hypothetical protein